MHQHESAQYTALVRSLHEIQTKLDIHFRDEGLLIQAFIHKSFLNEAGGAYFPSYERLEFLGDAILNLAVAEYLFTKEQAANEGDLSKVKSHIVSQKSLCQTMASLDLSRYLLTGKGEKLHKLALQEAVQADLFEAILGALFIDQGWESAKEFVLRIHIPRCDFTPSSQENPKAMLQEWCLKKKQGLPRYAVIKEEGPQHDPLFTIGVYVQDALIKDAKGKSKRQAEVEAAKNALEILMRQQQDSE